MDARYYDPTTGRFLSEDPSALTAPEQFISDPQQQNGYSYVRNNPTTIRDANGKCIEDACIVEGAIALGLAEGPQILNYGSSLIQAGIGAYQAQKNIVSTFSNPNASVQEKASAIASIGLIFSGGVEGSGEEELSSSNQSAVENGSIQNEEIKTRYSLPDEALCVRGGTCTAQQFETGNHEPLQDGKLTNISVNSASGKNLEELSKTIPNKQVGVTTVGQIRGAGGDVLMSGNAENPSHATLKGLTPQQAQTLFQPTRQNPNR